MCKDQGCAISAFEEEKQDSNYCLTICSLGSDSDTIIWKGVEEAGVEGWHTGPGPGGEHSFDVTFRTVSIVQDVQGREGQDDLLARKLILCRVVYTFPATLEKDERKGRRGEEDGREKKTATLEELLDFVTQHFHLLDREALRDLVEMVAKNLFRTLPRPSPSFSNRLSLLQEDEEECHDPAWPHLNLCYGILLAVLEHPDFHPSALKTTIDKKFVSSLLDLLGSSGLTERELVKTVLHRIYGTFLVLRRGVRDRIKELLLEVCHYGLCLPGAPQLLEVR